MSEIPKYIPEWLKGAADRWMKQNESSVPDIQSELMLYESFIAGAMSPEARRMNGGWIKAFEGITPNDGQIVDTWNGIANRRAIYRNVAGGLFERHIEPYANERIYCFDFQNVTHYRPLPEPPVE